LLEAWINGEIVSVVELTGATGREHKDHDVSAGASWRPGDGADVEVFDFVGDFSDRGQQDFGDDVASEVGNGSGRRGAGPKLQRPGAFMGGGVQEREPRFKMHCVAVEAVTMRPGEPDQLDGRNLN
jgi:hypothetical protein